MSQEITVLMTIYNGMPYLSEALESLLQQRYTDFKLLAIDDASTDGSAHCLSSCRDPRVRVIRNDRNMGQVASLNKGLGLVESEFVARLDQDDVCEPDRLMLQLATLKVHPEMAACGSWVTWMDAQGRKIGVAGFSVEDYGSFLGLLLGQTTPLAHPTVLMRTQILKALGGYDVGFAPCEDYDLWCRLAVRRMSVGVVPKPLVRLRLHSGQQSQQKLAAQRGHAKRAHLRLIEGFSSPQAALPLAALLRMDEEFWIQDPDVALVRSVCRDLSRMLQRIVQEKGLTDKESCRLNRRVSGWLARCAFLGILRQRFSSIFIYLSACRLGLPPPGGLALAAYPAALLFSPFFFLRPLRDGLFRFVWWMNRTRYLARLAWNNLRAP